MRVWVLCAFLVACVGKSSDTGIESGAEKDPWFPFPSMHHMSDGHVAFPVDLPMSAGGTPIPVDRIAWRTGFSVAQTSVIDMGQVIDKDSLPGQSEPVTDGSVQIWDLTLGTPIRCFAELDAALELGDETATMMVRPQDPLPVGHRIAVVVTEDVTTDAGMPVEPLPWFTDVLAGDPGPGLDEWVEHYQALVGDLEALGVDDIVLAFDFPVSDGSLAVRTVAEDVSVPQDWRFEEIRDEDEGIIFAEGGWRHLSGHFTTDNWLVEDTYLELIDGEPQQQDGTVEAELYAYMPDSVRDAEPGSVPVWMFGHGLFGSPDEYLARQDDRSKVIKLADEAGAIVIATVWRGFKSTDRLPAIEVAEDFAKLPMLTNRLTQGVANTIALSRLILEGGLLDDPELRGLPAKGDIRYYGISLGGIAGAVMLANNPRIPHGVLHVGGAAWSTMVERSSQWIPFDWIMQENIPSPRERQLLYAFSQMFWDPVDPMSYVDDLKGRSLLWQEAIGDEQVANMTTEMIARAAGSTQLSPTTWDIIGLPVSEGPITGPAIAQYDPETTRPDEDNRPAGPSGAHSNPRTWPGCRQQTAHFLDWETPGTVLHFCGESVCAESNPGTELSAGDD